MKNICKLLVMVTLASTSASAQGKTLTNDPLTGLALIPAASGMLGNAPTEMPEAVICTSKFKGNLYSINSSPTDNATMGPTVAWYAAHLKGFTHVHGYSSERSQDAFYNAGGTLAVIVTSDKGPESKSAHVYGVAFERYQPGLKPKVFLGLTTGNIDCR
ncbi:MAG: hypothetical protein M3Y05_04810 [Gemmatimonadota bacterium]|nr:hypothetical protein [Gemmatimonadota bacterium]